MTREQWLGFWLLAIFFFFFALFLALSLFSSVDGHTQPWPGPRPPMPMGPPQRHYYPGPPYFSGPYPRFDDGSGQRFFRIPNYDPRIDPRMFRPPPNLPPPWMFPH